MEDSIDYLGEEALLVLLGCNSGHWEIPVVDENKKKKALTFRINTYRSNGMPLHKE